MSGRSVQFCITNFPLVRVFGRECGVGALYQHDEMVDFHLGTSERKVKDPILVHMLTLQFHPHLQDAPSSAQKGIGGNDQTLLTSHRREKMLQAAYFLFTNDLTANFVASLTAEAILYPLETIAVRLCVQGTRTLVDNLDTGESVIPIITSFDGAFDVLRYSSSSASGFIGLYRGFGALILQYATQFALLVGMKYASERVFYYISPTSTQPPPPPIGRSSIPADYEPTNQHSSAFQSPFYSTAPHLLNHQPTTSVWQPNLDSERWRSSDPNLTSANEAPSNPTRSSFAFRGFSPGPYDQPL